MTTLAETRLIPADSRGGADHGWLKSRFSFSFADWYDPERMQFESLRVINDDFVAAGRGFPPHSHRDAEIFSYILEGKLEHKDSMGNGSTVSAGGIQYMSAGSGVTHSEFNPSASDDVRFLQIWLLPDEQGAAPRYDTLQLSETDKRGTLKLFLSKTGRGGSLSVRQDADIYCGLFDGSERASHVIAPGRAGYIQVAKGALTVNGTKLSKGDGLALTAGGLEISGGQEAEILLFDLAKLN